MITPSGLQPVSWLAMKMNQSVEEIESLRKVCPTCLPMNFKFGEEYFYEENYVEWWLLRRKSRYPKLFPPFSEWLNPPSDNQNQLCLRHRNYML